MINLFKWSYSQFLFSWNIVSNLLNWFYLVTVININIFSSSAISIYGIATFSFLSNFRPELFSSFKMINVVYTSVVMLLMLACCAMILVSTAHSPRHTVTTQKMSDCQSSNTHYLFYVLLFKVTCYLCVGVLKFSLCILLCSKRSKIRNILVRRKWCGYGVQLNFEVDVALTFPASLFVHLSNKIYKASSGAIVSEAIMDINIFNIVVIAGIGRYPGLVHGNHTIIPKG